MLSGDLAIVGAHLDDDTYSNSGSAYIYRWSGSQWNEEQKLTSASPAQDDEYGVAVAIEGDIAVVGVHQDDDGGTNTGSVYVYRYDELNSIWNQEQKLTASDAAANDHFGYALAISGGVIVVGAYADDLTAADAGSAYVFRYNGSTWNQEQKLTASDAAANDWFGTALDAKGDLLIVGARLNDDNGSNSGSAYIYRYNGASWVQEQKLLASDAAAADEFGMSVAIDNNLAVVGAPYDDDNASGSGSAYVFRYGGSTWAQETKLHANDPGTDERFGFGASLQNNNALIGASWDGENGLQSGAAYVFHYENSTWLQRLKLTASDGSTSNEYGRTVSISEGRVLCASRFNLSNGAAYMYDLASLAPEILAGFPCADVEDPEHPDIELYVGKLNPADNDEDKIIGRWCADMGEYVAYKIVWGYCDASPANEPYLRCETKIFYPIWEDLEVTLAIGDFNSNDDTDDMLFGLKGKNGATVGAAQVVFGQDWLSVETLNLAKLDQPDNIETFYARDFRAHAELQDPALRDNSGRNSYRIIIPSFDVSATPPLPMPPPSDIVSGIGDPAEALPSVHVFPNPTRIVASMHALNIPHGDYSIALVTPEGAILRTEQVKVDAAGEFLRIFELHDLASGYYVLKLYSKARFIGAYPLMIIR